MLLVTCGNDVRLHSCSQYDLVHVYRPPDCTGSIRNVSWCKDGSMLAIVPYKGNAEIIRTKDDVKLLQSIMGVAQPTTAVFQRTTKKNIAIGTANGSILVYDIKGHSVKKRFANGSTTVTMLDWSFKDTHLAAAGADGQVSIFSNTTNQKVSTVVVPASRSISTIRFHQTQRNLLGCASDEGAVVVWDNNTGKRKFFMQTHKAPVTDLVFSLQNNSLMTSVGLDRTFQCYDTNAGEVVLTVLTDHPLSAIDMAPNGHTVAVASIRGTVYIYDLRHYSSPFKTILAHTGEIKRILYQPQTSDSGESINLPDDRTVKTETDNTTPIQRNSSVDSFAQIMGSALEFSTNMEDCMEQEEDIKKDRLDSATGDSFLAEISPNRNASVNFFAEKSHELSNLGITEGVKKWIDSKHNLMDSSVPHHGAALDIAKEKFSEGYPGINLKPTSSTPRLNKLSFVQNQDIQDSKLSPIVVVGAPQSVNIDEVRKVIKETVAEVVSDQMSELMDALSRNFLNLQLSFSKQFVCQEEQIARLGNARGPSNSSLQLQIQQLKEENEFLKQKINENFRNGNE